MQFGPLEHSGYENLKNLKTQDDGGRHLEKSPYLGNGAADLDQIWHSDTFNPLTVKN